MGGAALLACVLPIACGSDGGGDTQSGAVDGGGDEGLIRAAYREFGRAYADGDGEKTCALMTPAAQKELATNVTQVGTSGNCSKLVAAIRSVFNEDDLRKVRAAKATKITLTGDTALVEGTGTIGGGDDGPSSIRKVSGKWLFDADPATK